MEGVKVSDYLLLLLEITSGMEAYQIDAYYGKLIQMGFVELEYYDDKIKYVLTDKGKLKVNTMKEG